VIASYGLPDGPGEDAGDLDQVLVQAQTRDIAVSGVVFTAELKTNAPYYVINHDRSGRSDVVTAGLGGELVRVFRKCPPERLDSPFREVLAAVQEIESIVPGYNLDIEFAVDGLGEVVIFQVRPLAANARPDAAAEARTLSAIRAAERQYARGGQHPGARQHHECVRQLDPAGAADEADDQDRRVQADAAGPGEAGAEGGGGQRDAEHPPLGVYPALLQQHPDGEQERRREELHSPSRIRGSSAAQATSTAMFTATRRAL